jgi:dihydroxy-acid dehydratase
MSGTSYGACVLHIAPESFIGGPLALIRTGDIISTNVADRRIEVELSDDDLRARRENWTPPAPRYERGFGQMFSQHVTQADKGCDFDYLEVDHGRPVDEPAIY